jgi:hypothetical protein
MGMDSRYRYMGPPRRAGAASGRNRHVGPAWAGWARETAMGGARDGGVDGSGTWNEQIKRSIRRLRPCGMMT